jgi:hypothetical protein
MHDVLLLYSGVNHNIYNICNIGTYSCLDLYSKALLRHLTLVFTGVGRLIPFYQGSIKALDRTEASAFIPASL